MELKYGSNWCDWLMARSSNRTFMELKFLSNNKNLKQNYVLIVPLWN